MAAKDLVEYVAKSLVDDPDAVTVEVVVEDGGTVIEVEFAEPVVLGGFALELADLLPLLPIPLLGLIGLGVVFVMSRKGSHGWPFVGALLVFLSGYLGLAAGFAPYIVPYVLNFRQAAAPDNALALMLVGTAVILPLILAYTAWVYWVFRGKIDEEAGYHH